MLMRSWLGAGFGGVFAILMLVAAGWDLKRRRIPNAVVVVTLLLGVTFAVLTLGPRRGAWSAAEGAALGLAIWVPWWWLAMMGAGDVKFFAAAAVWLGPRGALGAAIATALLGGVLGVGWLIARSLARGEVAQLPTRSVGEDAWAISDVGEAARDNRPLPYGVAMAAGLGVAAWIQLIR